MKIVQQQLVIVVSLFILFTISYAQLCPGQEPENRRDAAASSERLEFPVIIAGDASGPDFNVTSHNSPWILNFFGINLNVFADLASDSDTLITFFYANLIDESTGASVYPFYAFGTATLASLRGSPDFKWATIKDIYIPGDLYHPDGTPYLRFNVSIQFAEFWTDTPADNSFVNKRSERSLGTDCIFRSIFSGGSNRVYSKNFWINFYFEDGQQASFSIPNGYAAGYSRSQLTNFYVDCVC